LREISEKGQVIYAVLNEYIVFSVTLREFALATYDKKLRKLASRSGLHIIP
jgi:hypothetical protein